MNLLESLKAAKFNTFEAKKFQYPEQIRGGEMYLMSQRDAGAFDEGELCVNPAVPGASQWDEVIWRPAHYHSILTFFSTDIT